MDFTFSDNIWIYILGAIGYLIYICASYCKSRTNLLSCEVVGGLLVALQWILLGEVIPAAMNIAFGYVAFLGLYVGRFNGVKYIYPLVFPFCIGVFYFYGTGGLTDILALSASIPSLCARYFRNIYVLRSLSVSGSLSWLVINLSSGVVIGAMCNILYMAGHLMHMSRAYQEHKKTKEDHGEMIKELSPA